MKHICKNGTEVYVSNKRDFEYYIKKFNKKIQKAGILSKLHEKKYYESPSEKRKRKAKESTIRVSKEKQKALNYKKKRRKEPSEGYN